MWIVWIVLVLVLWLIGYAAITTWMDSVKRKAIAKKFKESVPEDAFFYGENSAVWYDCDDEILHRYTPETEELAISLNQIIKFEKEGQVYHDSIVSGGGTSWVTGLDKKINTNTQVVDTRRTILCFKDPDQKETWRFPHSVYERFIEWFPEKEGAVVEEVRRQKLIKKQLEGNS